MMQVTEGYNANVGHNDAIVIRWNDTPCNINMVTVLKTQDAIRLLCQLQEILQKGGPPVKRRAIDNH